MVDHIKRTVCRSKRITNVDIMYCELENWWKTGAGRVDDKRVSKSKQVKIESTFCLFRSSRIALQRKSKIFDRIIRHNQKDLDWDLKKEIKSAVFEKHESENRWVNILKICGNFLTSRLQCRNGTLTYLNTLLLKN